MVITNHAMPPKNNTPIAAHGSGDDQMPGSDSGDGEGGIGSGECCGCAAGGCRGEVPDDRPGRTIDVVGVRAGIVGDGVGVGGIALAVGDGRGVAVGNGGSDVGVGEGSASVGVGGGIVKVAVGVTGTDVGVTGDTGDWNHAPAAGPPSSAVANLTSTRSSKSCIAEPRLETKRAVQDPLRARKADNSHPRISFALFPVAERLDQWVASKEFAHRPA